MFIPISEVNKHENKRVHLRGWIYRQRESKGIVFLILRDSSGLVQCVIKEGQKGFEEASKVRIEASVALTGKVHKDSRAPTGWEIETDSFEIIGWADKFPITKDQSTEHLLDFRHLWVRSQRLNSIFKIRSDVFGAIHSFFRGRSFFEIQSPCITKQACEGGSTLFKFNYFGQEAFLTQSWQLHAEALIYSLEKIYTIAPSFRAEKSRTRRHLAEYWHAEAEAAWLDHKGNLKLQEDLIWHIIKTIATGRKEELKSLGRDPKHLLAMKPPYQIVPYKKALELLKKNGMKLKWGDDFGVNHEKELTSHFKKPFFVTEYPKEAKAFYMKENPKDKKTFLCNDMLAPEGYGEIIGGSERETDNKKLIENLKNSGASKKDYEWYFDLRNYGSVPHSGFGLGVERLVMWLAKLEHIRDTIAFPRVMNRVYP
jgi:asparaginyl-tRNA synthetase